MLGGVLRGADIVVRMRVGLRRDQRSSVGRTSARGGVGQRKEWEGLRPVRCWAAGRAVIAEAGSVVGVEHVATRTKVSIVIWVSRGSGR